MTTTKLHRLATVVVLLATGAWRGVQAQPSESLLRRTLAVIGQRLEQNRPQHSLRELVINAAPFHVALPEDVKQLRAAAQKLNKPPGTGKPEAPPGDGPTVGNLDAGLSGGKFTAYPLSRFGLDLSGSIGAADLKILFREDKSSQAQNTPPAQQPVTTRGASLFRGSDKLNQRQQSPLPHSLNQSFDAGYGLGDELLSQGSGMGSLPFSGNYLYEGMRASVGSGDMKLDVLNWHREPDRQKKDFFGNNSTGPYALGTTAMFPGTEEVSLNGQRLSAGAYTLDTATGRLTFRQVISTSDRVTVDFDVIGDAQNQPGTFTGVRLSGSVPGGEVGFTHMGQKMVGFEQQSGGGITRNVREQAVFGFDGKIKVAGQEIELETASASGQRRRSNGVLSTATFRTTDTTDITGSPDGPYLLPQNKLPVIEGSAQVLMDGFTVPTAQYTLDLQQGVLTFQKNAINFTGAETIEVRYRYRQDVGIAGGNEEGTALRAALKGKLGRLSHQISRETTGQNFFQLGQGMAGGQSEKLNQKYTLDLGRDHSLSFADDTTKRLVDDATGLMQEDKTTAWQWGLKRESFNLQLNQSKRTQSGGGASENEDFGFKGDVKASEKLKLDFVWDRKDQRSPGRMVLKEAQQVKLAFTPNAVMDFSLQGGEQKNEETAPTGRSDQGGGFIDFAASYHPSDKVALSIQQGQRPSTGTRQVIQLKYHPGQKLQVDYGLENGSSPTVAAGVEQLARTGTRQDKQSLNLRYMPFQAVMGQLKLDTQDVTNPDGSQQDNGNTQMILTYAPGPALRLTAVQQWRTQEAAKIKTDNTVTSLQAGFKLKTRWGLDLVQTLVDQQTGVANVQSDQWSATVTFPKQRFVRDLQFHVKTESQQTESAVSTSVGLARTRQNAGGLEWKLEARPFWRERLLQLTFRRRDTRIVGQQGTQDTSLRTLLEVPFVGQSHLALAHELTRQNQTNGDALTQAYETLLKGSVGKKLTLTGGYRARHAKDVSRLVTNDEQWSLEGSVDW